MRESYVFTQSSLFLKLIQGYRENTFFTVRLRKYRKRQQRTDIFTISTVAQDHVLGLLGTVQPCVSVVRCQNVATLPAGHMFSFMHSLLVLSIVWYNAMNL